MNNANELLANPKAFQVLCILFAVDSSISRMLASGEILSTPALRAAGGQLHAAGLVTFSGPAPRLTPGLYMTRKGHALFREAKKLFNLSIHSAEFRARYMANGGGAA